MYFDKLSSVISLIFLEHGMMVFMCNMKKISSELSVQELLQEILWKNKIYWEM